MRNELLEILRKSADPEAMAWLDETVASQVRELEKRPFYYAFSGVSRRFDKAARVSAPELREVDGWDEFRVARIVLLLVLAEQEREPFLETFHTLLDTADIREQVALFSALRWLPYQRDLIERAVDGLRSNIIDIFDAIALDNPFPREHFTEEAWNQMVLKAIFISRPLYRIEGVAERRNRALAEAVSDLAHERWAAGRAITPEAWRNCIGQVDERIAADITRVASSENPEERQGAALAVSEDDSPLLAPLRENLAGELDAVENGTLTWDSLGREMEEILTRKSLT